MVMDKNGAAMKKVNEAFEVVDDEISNLLTQVEPDQQAGVVDYSGTGVDYTEVDYSGTKALKTNLVWKMNTKARATVEEEIQNCGKEAESLNKRLKEVMARRDDAVKARDAIDLSLKFLEEYSPDVVQTE